MNTGANNDVIKFSSPDQISDLSLTYMDAGSQLFRCLNAISHFRLTRVRRPFANTSRMASCMTAD
jgi:hypothetical protein